MIDLTDITRRASRKSYDLGYGLYASNSVSKLLIVDNQGDNQVTATVAGQFKYQVILTHFANNASESQASCTCPAAEYQNVCKHAVAVALHVTHLSEKELAELSQEVDEQNDERTQLMAWLQAKPTSELSEIIMSLLDGSEHEYRKWMMLMKSDTQPMEMRELNKLINQALPKEPAWDWHEVSGYFTDADQLFEIIFPAMAKLSIEQQWTLNLNGLIRLNEVLENIDDSGGFRFTIEEQLNSNLSTLFNQLPWPDPQKAQWLFEHFKTYEYDVFPSVPDDFNMTTEVKAAFLSLCQTGVDDLLKAGMDFDNRAKKSEFNRLISALIDEAEAQGDWPAQRRLLLMKADSTGEYLQISELCLARGDELDAEYYLKLAYQCAHTTYEQLSCKKWEIKVRLALAEFKPAWTLAWQLFLGSPSVHSLKKLQQLERQTGVIEPDLLLKVEQVLLKESKQTRRFVTDTCEVLHFYLDQKMIEKARAWAAVHDVHSRQWVKLADVIMTTHPQEAIDLYNKASSALIDQTHNDAYREATDLLLNIEKQLKDTGDNGVALYTMINDLTKRFKQKRNMMKLLRQHFPQCFL